MSSDGRLFDLPVPHVPGEGDKIGPYRLLRLLGRGTSGRVFEVEHERLGRRAAMKVLIPEGTARRVAVKRLLTEALAVNRINHPHIVEITDIVEREKGATVDALVMELLEGQPLSQLMSSGARVPVDRFLPILAQVAAALAAAHAAGFAHRDLKPDNIFLITRDGQPDFVKLLDFGLAKRIDGDAGSSGIRADEGTFLGTPAYVSPEQAAGRPVDQRTDIYALGVVVYELCAGRLPFEGKSVGDFVLKHLELEPPHLSDEVRATPLGRTLDAVVQRCLRKLPSQRFISAGQLATIFEDLAHGEPVQFTAMSKYLADAPARWHPWAWAAGFALLLGVMGAATAWGGRNGPGARGGPKNERAAARPSPSAPPGETPAKTTATAATAEMASGASPPDAATPGRRARSRRPGSRVQADKTMTIDPFFNNRRTE